MQYTTKLKLKKPELTDYVNIADINDNMDIIDGEIAKMTDTETGVEAKFNQHAADKNNPHGVTKTQVGLGSVQNYGVATQAEAEAGTSATKYMTPERTKQAVDKSLVPLNQEFTRHLGDMAKHNQFTDGNKTYQVILGWDITSNCPTMDYVEVIE